MFGWLERLLVIPDDRLSEKVDVIVGTGIDVLLNGSLVNIRALGYFGLCDIKAQRLLLKCDT